MYAMKPLKFGLLKRGRFSPDSVLVRCTRCEQHIEVFHDQRFIYTIICFLVWVTIRVDSHCLPDSLEFLDRVGWNGSAIHQYLSQTSILFQLQKRMEEQRSHWKAYVSMLHSIALNLIMDLPQWWSKQYGDQPRAGSTVGATRTTANTKSPFQFRAALNRTDYSIPYLSGQLEHLALTASDQLPTPKAKSLAEVDQLLEDTSAMELQLNSYQKELGTYGR